MNRLAVIDLGTNTFNLLVVDYEGCQHKEVYATKVGVGLGLGGINENRIAPEAQQRGLDTLTNYVQKCDELSVKQIVAFGTSAIRNATNSEQFIQKVKAQLNLDIEVVSGQREAELIYQGVTLGLDVQEPFIIMDIGGGSTEFILGDKHRLKETASFEIGAARIYQSRNFQDPYSQEDINFIEDYLNAGVGHFFDGVSVEQLIGASGSFETFFEILNDQPYPAHQYVQLNKEELMKVLDRIIHSTLSQREADTRIIPIRKKMAPIAAIKIRWIIRKLNIQKIMISPYSLKEGVISETIGINKNDNAK
ncbi:Ppx/GppA phosphatase family protein [Crocinitomix algicola]|uniref:Ppx/GppA phosphatase family protein n=1 Tax=Crocinitomix algicola TaxID=1740263 RepID=UPI000871FFE1|nr:hypothetical protein [Crocinitomix algicola]